MKYNLVPLLAMLLMAFSFAFLAGNALDRGGFGDAVTLGLSSIGFFIISAVVGIDHSSEGSK